MEKRLGKERRRKGGKTEGGKARRKIRKERKKERGKEWTRDRGKEQRRRNRQLGRSEGGEPAVAGPQLQQGQYTAQRRGARYDTARENTTSHNLQAPRRDESADARSVHRYTPHYTTLRERTAQKRESYTSRYSLGGTQGRTRYTDKQTYTTHHGTFTHQRSSTSIILHHIHKTHESDSATRPSSTTTNTGPTPRRPLPRCN